VDSGITYDLGYCVQREDSSLRSVSSGLAVRSLGSVFH